MAENKLSPSGKTSGTSLMSAIFGGKKDEATEEEKNKQLLGSGMARQAADAITKRKKAMEDVMEGS